MAATLPALVAELADGDELIVVDNDSADDTVAAVRAAAPEATVIEAGANLGFAAACNRGARGGGRPAAVLPQPRRGARGPAGATRSWSPWRAASGPRGRPW